MLMMQKKKSLKNISYEYFTLKHNPNKENPEYFNKFLTSYDFKPDQLIYFEHIWMQLNQLNPRNYCTSF